MIGPTTALPGSAAKIRIMRQRAEAGEPLFHPADVHVAILQDQQPVSSYRGYNPQGTAWVEPAARAARAARRQWIGYCAAS